MSCNCHLRFFPLIFYSEANLLSVDEDEDSENPQKEKKGKCYFNFF